MKDKGLKEWDVTLHTTIWAKSQVAATRKVYAALHFVTSLDRGTEIEKDFSTWGGLCLSFPGGVRLTRVVHSYQERREWLKESPYRDLPAWKLREGLVLLFMPLKIRELHEWLARVGEG